jgi:hypothetical protein
VPFIRIKDPLEAPCFRVKIGDAGTCEQSNPERKENPPQECPMACPLSPHALLLLPRNPDLRL